VPLSNSFSHSMSELYQNLYDSSNNIHQGFLDIPAMIIHCELFSNDFDK
jgi:hypothetical protein